ncbi:MAG TPA: hypothetical protein VFX31_13110 [Ktedonobacterales bacterium]|jgi:hypothetical protein|nr:hypothetical protein [Ktedonobacterales bacterium]HEX5572325.1 hypothetical protein [Ktedonobacterales bacterium]
MAFKRRGAGALIGARFGSRGIMQVVEAHGPADGLGRLASV